jgi:predicted permease
MRAFLNDLAYRLRALFRRSQVEAELDDELRAHLESQVEKYLRAGMPRGEAARRARLELGGLEQVKEECRDARGTRWLEGIAQDIRYGVRLLRRSPAFTLVAILSLALGIGANTAVFSLLDSLALRELPVPHPEQLTRVVAHRGDDASDGLSLPMYEEIARRQSVFSSMFAWWGDGVFNLEANGTLTHADVWAVSGNFHSELGAVPELGRLLGPEDVNLRAAPAQVAVLSYGCWQRIFGGSREALGGIVKVEGVSFIVIGVTRAGFPAFNAERSADVTIPLTEEPLITDQSDVAKALARPDALWLDAAGRLKPGVTLSQARAQLETLWPAIRQDILTSDMNDARRSGLTTLQLKLESGSRGESLVRGRFTHPLEVLLAISGLVVLVACANLASLMLARAAAREHELGVRIALGAGRARLFCQMLTESVTLSAAGTLLGFLFAQWASRALAKFVLGQVYIVPAALDLSPDLRILCFAAASAFLTGLIFGIAPAWRAWRQDPIAALQQTLRTGGIGRLGRALIVTQVAVSVVLVVGAGLFLRSLGKLRAAEPGFRTRDMLVVNLFPRPEGYKDLNLVDYYRQLTERISALPSVTSAGMIHIEPGSIVRWTEQIRPSGTTSAGLTSDFEMVMPGALRTLGIYLLRGREFNWQDDDHAPRVALLSRGLAEKLFPDGDAIGKRLDITTEPKWHGLEIVGIVSDASLYDLRDTLPPTLYAPSMQYGDYMGWSEMLVATGASPSAMRDTLSGAIDSFGRESIFSIHTIEEGISRLLMKERLVALLSAFFGGLALLLAAIGLYGLLSYNVSQRTREIGIRMALGAQRGDVRAMVLRETFLLTGLGVASGLPCAIAASHLAAGLLYGVSGSDGVTLLGVIFVLAAAACVAGFLPARRATRVDPIIALRYE